MAETLYKDTTYTVSLLVQSISAGKIALPDIQRPFVWQAAKVREQFLRELAQLLRATSSRKPVNSAGRDRRRAVHR